MTATANNTFGDTGIAYEIRNGAEEMNAGKYRVTDPCYFLGHDDDFWQGFCQFMFGENSTFSDDCYTIEIEGHKILAFGTAYGDGCYPTLENGSEIGSSGVDAGMLSLIPLELYEILKGHLGDNDDSSAPTVEMNRSFTPDVHDGDCEFGNYQILTGDTATQCRHCGDYTETNWNDLCDYCQQEEDEEEERRLEEEEEEERRRMEEEEENDE